MSVSAVIVTLNEADSIVACIESLLNQTVKPSEILLIDANSTDDTVALAQQYPIQLYSVNFHDIYRSKRLGILMAENSTVLCIDGDSWINSDFIADGLTLLNQGYDLACGEIHPANPNPLTLMIAWMMNHQTDYLSGPAYMIKRGVYLQVCQIKRVDGLQDKCERSRELPLYEFKNRIKSDKLQIYTRLPTRLQTEGVGIVTAGSAGLLLLTHPKL